MKRWLNSFLKLEFLKILRVIDLSQVSSFIRCFPHFLSIVHPHLHRWKGFLPRPSFSFHPRLGVIEMKPWGVTLPITDNSSFFLRTDRPLFHTKRLRSQNEKSLGNLWETPWSKSERYRLRRMPYPSQVESPDWKKNPARWDQWLDNWEKRIAEKRLLYPWTVTGAFLKDAFCITSWWSCSIEPSIALQPHLNYSICLHTALDQGSGCC